MYILRITCFFSWVGIVGNCSAWHMDSYDLASLCYLAEVIVEVDSEPDFKTHKIRRVFKGGDLIQKDEALMVNTKGYDPNQLNWLGNRDIVHSASQVLFLHKVKRVGPQWFCVSSGLKVLTKQDVYGFIQIRNPGGWSPTRQSFEFGNAKDKSKPYTPAVFFKELDLALAFSQRIATAIEQKDIKKIRQYIDGMIIEQKTGKRSHWHTNAIYNQAVEEYCRWASPAKVFDFLFTEKIPLPRNLKGFHTPERYDYLLRPFEKRQPYGSPENQYIQIDAREQ